ncbi:MAG: glycosyltransferase family 4 protein, partial [Gemmatimonadaceae bacterium]
MTSASNGGAEIQTRRLLEALADRGHEAVLLTNGSIVGGSALTVDRIDLGPKLSRASWRSVLLRWGRHVRSLRSALERHAPYDVLLVTFKKEQLLVPWLPRRLRLAVVWLEHGPVPRQLGRGIQRQLFRHAARGARAVLAVSNGTRDSLVAA